MRVIDVSNPRSSRLGDQEIKNRKKKKLSGLWGQTEEATNRSASSKTRTSSSLQLTTFRPLPKMNSSTRPGVPTTMSALVSKNRETSCSGVEAEPEIRRSGSGYVGGCELTAGMSLDPDDG